MAASGVGLFFLGCSTTSTGGFHSATSTPAMAVLPILTAANIPTMGPDGIPIDAPTWTVLLDEGTGLSGKGLGERPML